MADTQHSLQAYISDMLALEEHIRIPFQTQLMDGDLSGYPGADTMMERLRHLSNAHVAALRAALESAGGYEGHALKSAVASVEGWFAGAIDEIRKSKVAKSLRDDYTVLSLCCVSYSMLATAANAYNAPAVAELALRHMRDYAQAIVDIGLLMPAVVVRDLAQSGMKVDLASATESRKQIEQVWRSNAAPLSRTTSGTIETDAAANRSSKPTYPTV